MLAENIIEQIEAAKGNSLNLSKIDQRKFQETLINKIQKKKQIPQQNKVIERILKRLQGKSKALSIIESL
jgi:hypothetical protein